MGWLEEHRTEFGKTSQTDDPLFEPNVFRVDGWTRDDDARWYPPENAREALPLASIASVDDPRAIVMGRRAPAYT